MRRKKQNSCERFHSTRNRHASFRSKSQSYVCGVKCTVSFFLFNFLLFFETGQQTMTKTKGSTTLTWKKLKSNFSAIPWEVFEGGQLKWASPSHDDRYNMWRHHVYEQISVHTVRIECSLYLITLQVYSCMATVRRRCKLPGYWRVLESDKTRRKWGRVIGAERKTCDSSTRCRKEMETISGRRCRNRSKYVVSQPASQHGRRRRRRAAF